MVALPRTTARRRLEGAITGLPTGDYLKPIGVAEAVVCRAIPLVRSFPHALDRSSMNFMSDTYSTHG